MPDYSVAFANIQSVVNCLEDPLKAELAEAASQLQDDIETDTEELELQVEDLSDRLKDAKSDLNYVKNNNLDLESKLSDLEYERDRQVRDLESKVSDLERDKDRLEYELRQAKDEAYRAQNRYY